MPDEGMDEKLREAVVTLALALVLAPTPLDFHLRLGKFLEAARALAVHRN